MTNTPDLTNASPGDVYEGRDALLWQITGRYERQIYMRHLPLFDSVEQGIGAPMDSWLWEGFKKIPPGFV